MQHIYCMMPCTLCPWFLRKNNYMTTNWKKGLFCAQLVGMHMPAVRRRAIYCAQRPPACRNEVSICFAPCVGISTMKTVLFACIHNAGRSQMSNAMFNHLADPEKARGISAGTQPGTRVHPEVLVAMSELGVDLSSVQPQLLTPELAETSDLLITMGCGGSSSARQH